VADANQRDETLGDPVEQLARLFAENPAWDEAARYLDPAATSDIYFSHEPGRVWHIERRAGVTQLLPGASERPDLVFRFSPHAVRELSREHDGIAAFAIALFRLALAPDPDRGVRIRIVAPFIELTRRGYVKLLLAGGPSLLAFGVEHGVRGLADLRALVRRLRRSESDTWERDGR